MSTAINFGSTRPGKIHIQHRTLENNEVNSTTYFFRDDLNWHLLAEMMKYDFPDNTDVFIGASSDGTEAYSLKMLTEKKAPGKKFNFNGFDIVRDKVAEAQSGIVKIFNECRYTISDFVGNDIFGKNFELLPPNHKTDTVRDYREYISTPHMREGLKFSVGDVLDEARIQKTKPCIFMFRNVWPYLKSEVRVDLAKKLKKSLPSQSIACIGGYDDQCKTSQLLLTYGFEQVRGGLNLYRRK